MEQAPQENPLQGYWDWQVNTLMLAHDLANPIPRGEEQRVQERRREVEDEVRQMVMSLLPERYKQDPTLDWPPELMMKLTRATLSQAVRIAGL